MVKQKIYSVNICLVTNGDVHTAYCVCPAGLAGCCNHVAALLYALEEFVRLGLREESRLPCTSKLQQWNRPRCRHVRPTQVMSVALEKEEHGKANQQATRRHYDPRPPNMRIPDPRERLQPAKDLEAEHERQRNQDTTGRVAKYGSSCLFSLLQPTSSEESAEETSGESSESIDSEADSEAMAAACTSTISGTGIPVLSEEDFFKTCVEVSQEQADALEERTRLQSSSNEWFLERRKRITATLVKAVACRRRLRLLANRSTEAELHAVPRNTSNSVWAGV